MRTLTKTHAFGRQSVSMTELMELNGHKLKLEIKSDAYSFQSHARVSILEKAPSVKWNYLHSIPPTAMATPEGLIYQPASQLYSRNGGAVPSAIMAKFDNDRNALIEVAKMLLG